MKRKRINVLTQDVRAGDVLIWYDDYYAHDTYSVNIKENRAIVKSILFCANKVAYYFENVGSLDLFYNCNCEVLRNQG